MSANEDLNAKSRLRLDDDTGEPANAPSVKCLS